jgi:lysozyme family protein
MPNISLSPRLRDEYQRLFAECRIRDNRSPEVEAILADIEANRSRYTAVEAETGVPWYVVAVIHCLECALDFTRHLHNGDPLTRRTVHEPAGRPKTGTPPFTWEESARDALTLKRLHQWQDWSVPGILYQLEAFNGWGYRLYHPHVLSPYLWSYSNHYTSGKYVADGTWSETAVSRQCGAAVLLRRMAEKGMIDLAIEAEPQPAEPLLRYSADGPLPYARQLQEFLNTLPGIYVKVDGWPGPKTSEAFKKATGYYLVGDPRAASE